MEIVLNNIMYSIQNKVILDNINLNIKTNSITAIVGKSGSGKTILLEIIDKLIKPTNGNISLKTDKIGMVFQFSEEQFFCSTVKKEIEFGLRYKNDITLLDKKVNDALKMVGLSSEYLNRNPFSLSSGEKKKVAIASILALNPEIIILDEPTMGLDNMSKENLIKIIKLLKKRYGKTIIIASNDTDFVHNISDDIVILHEGKVVSQGNKYDVFTSNVNCYGINRPKIIEFEKKVQEMKGIKLLYRDDINDLMKDIYRNVK